MSSNDKKLMSISKNGENEKVEADLKSYIRNDHIFGLTLQKTSESFIVSSLSIKGLIFNVSKSRVQTIQTNLGNLYGLATADTTTSNHHSSFHKEYSDNSFTETLCLNCFFSTKYN